MLRILLLLLSITSCLIVHTQNRPLPPNFPSYEFELTELSHTGHYCLNSYELHPETFVNMFMLDSSGYVAWYRKDQRSVSGDFKYHPAANVFTSIGYNPDVGAVFYTYDSALGTVDSLVAVAGETGDRHDFLVLPDGHKIITTVYDTIMDLRGYTFNGFGGIEDCVVRGFGIQEFDAYDSLVWTWHSTDHVHPEEFADGLNYYPYDFDYAHGNALQLDAEGNLLVSMRNTSTVYKIDRANRTGAILWRLGGENSSFQFEDTAAAFSAQHHSQFLPNGDVVLFDNGNLRVPFRFSRAAEYSLDFSDSIATVEWSYEANRMIFASGLGSVQWINDNLMLIGWGYVFRPQPTFSLVNRQGEVLTKLFFEDGYVTYRVQAADLPFALPRPYLSSEVGEDGVTISAPEGYSSYVWSTGDTTRTITVTTNGTYQAWVPHGIGMVGSYPVEISEVVNDDELAASTLKVFPNPTREALNIHLSSDREMVYSLELYDTNGRRIWYSAGPLSVPDTRIDVSSFTSGLYYLRVYTPAGVLTRRVVLF